MNIRPMSDADGEAVMQIYQQGCDTGHATFAEHAGEWTEYGIATIYPNVAWLPKWQWRDVGRRAVRLRLARRAEAVFMKMARALAGRLAALPIAKHYWTLRALIFPENTAILIYSPKWLRISGDA